MEWDINLFGLLILGLIALGSAAGMLISGIKAGRRLRKKALDGFGAVPARCTEEIGSIADYADFREQQEADSSRVDATTWDDLEFDRVFRRIDCCRSAVGQEHLYDRLHCLSDPAGCEWQEGLIAHLERHPQERERIQVLLAKLGKRDGGGIPRLLSGDGPRALPCPWLYRVLAVLPFLSPLCFFLSPLAGFCAVFGAVVLNFAVYHLGKRLVERDLRSVGAFSGLLWCAEKLCGPGGCAYPPLRERLMNGRGPFRSFRGKPAARTGFSDLELLSEYVHILLLDNLRLYNRALRLATENAKALQGLYEAVGGLDAAISALSFRKSLPHWCRPEFRDSLTLEFAGLCHPLLSSPVGNDGVFPRDVLLTGSNASGKSTFLKALGVNAILAQSISTCAAEVFRLRPGAVLSSMAVRDSLTAGESYFVTELKSLRRITEAVKSLPCLCLIDEILKGTNTAERLAASQAVMEELSRRDCFCIVASHDIELAGALAGIYESYHFREEIRGDEILFDYKLKPGPSRTRNAIKLLSVMGFGSGVTARAALLAEQGGPAEKEPVS